MVLRSRPAWATWVLSQKAEANEKKHSDTFLDPIRQPPFTLENDARGLCKG